MSLLDDFEKIDEDLQITISKKAFKEALEEKASELIERIQPQYDKYEREIMSLNYELEHLKLYCGSLESRMEAIKDKIKKYELSGDLEILKHIQLLSAPEDWDF